MKITGRIDWSGSVIQSLECDRAVVSALKTKGQVLPFARVRLKQIFRDFDRLSLRSVFERKGHLAVCPEIGQRRAKNLFCL